MDALITWMFIRFTPYQTTTLPKWMFKQKLLFKSSLLLNCWCGIQVCPPNNINDLCLLFFILLLWVSGSCLCKMVGIRVQSGKGEKGTSEVF